MTIRLLTSVRLAWLHLFLLLMTTSALAADAPINIDPNQKRAEIRAQLLQFTPLGSDTKAVIAFIKTKLARNAGADPKVLKHGATGASTEGSDKTGVKVIKVNLRDYFESPALLTLDIPLPWRNALIAQWAFDKDDRLIELFLDRAPAE
jgi:hypothetical protein